MSAEVDMSLSGLLTPDATPDKIRPWAHQARRRADWFRGEAARLDAVADALYRWCAQNEEQQP